MNSSEKIWFVAEYPHHCGLIHSGKHAVRQGPRGRNPAGPSSQATLADEISGFEECNDCFLALCRDDRDFDLAFLDVEDGICGITLGEDNLTFTVLGYGDPAICLGEKRPRVKFGF
jgi:hypothetical protein